MIFSSLSFGRICTVQVYGSLLLFNFEQTIKNTVEISIDVFCLGDRKGCSCNRYNGWAKLLGGKTVRVTLTFIVCSWNLSAFILFGVYL